jgi:polyisoprenoid-binding protein YceI
MKNRYKLISALVITFFPLFANAQQIFICKAAQLSFFSEARLEDIEAHSGEGKVAFNVQSGELVFRVRIRSFHFKNGLMEEHFNENYMESDKYPEAWFKGTLNEKIDPSSPGQVKVTATGVLNLHGISKQRSIQGIVDVKNGKIGLNAEFSIPVSEHKIDIPNDKISNISQDIKVKITALCMPK